jgi:hypothetical protein
MPINQGPSYSLSWFIFPRPGFVSQNPSYDWELALGPTCGAPTPDGLLTCCRDPGHHDRHHAIAPGPAGTINGTFALMSEWDQGCPAGMNPTPAQGCVVTNPWTVFDQALSVPRNTASILAQNPLPVPSGGIPHPLQGYPHDYVEWSPPVDAFVLSQLGPGFQPAPKGLNCCSIMSPDSAWLCTRPTGHRDGRHMAHVLSELCAEWTDLATPGSAPVVLPGSGQSTCQNPAGAPNSQWVPGSGSIPPGTQGAFGSGSQQNGPPPVANPGHVPGVWGGGPSTGIHPNSPASSPSGNSFIFDPQGAKTWDVDPLPPEPAKKEDRCECGSFKALGAGKGALGHSTWCAWYSG